MSERSVPIFYIAEVTQDTRQAFGFPGKAEGKVVEVPAEKIAGNLQSFLSSFEPIVSSNSKVGEYIIDEIELSLNISGEGGVSLIAQSKLSAGASIKITLKRA